MKPLSPAEIRRVLDAELRSAKLVHEAATAALSWLLGHRFGDTVTVDELTSVVPWWDDPFDEPRPVSWFRYTEDDDHTEALDYWFACADSYRESFWQEFGFEAQRELVRVEDVRFGDYAELWLLTDGISDWWFTSSTFQSEDDDVLCPPTDATPENRRSEIQSFVDGAPGWLRAPEQVATSLTGEDFLWLQSACGMPVRYRGPTKAPL